jgi:hypothetical protein
MNVVYGPNSWDEFQSPSQVQNKISRQQLARVRPSSGPARKYQSLGLRRRNRLLEASAKRAAGCSEEVLRSRDRAPIYGGAIYVRRTAWSGLVRSGPVLVRSRFRGKIEVFVNARHQARISPQFQFGGGMAEHRLHSLDRPASLKCPAGKRVSSAVEVEGGTFFVLRALVRSRLNARAKFRSSRRFR